LVPVNIVLKTADIDFRLTYASAGAIFVSDEFAPMLAEMSATSR